MSSPVETFLEPTRVLLFGKVFSGLSYQAPPATTAPPMVQGALGSALQALGTGGRFARIYGFSYEGRYYKLSRPALFLVSGPGTSTVSGNGEPQFTTNLTGVEGKDWQFGTDILVWAVDKQDIAVRLDLEVGSFDQVLLQPSGGRQEEIPTFRNAMIPQGRMLGPHQNR
jgi:hypothetical protein